MFKLSVANLLVLVLMLGLGQIDQCDQCDDTRLEPAAVAVGALAAGDTLRSP